NRSMPQRSRNARTRCAGVFALAGSLSWLATSPGLAQEAPEGASAEEASTEAPAAAPTPPPESPAPAPQTVEVKVSVVPPAAPAPAPEDEAEREEPPPPETSGFAPKLNIGVGVRTGVS